MQAELAQATKELATGRYADVGRELGFRTGQSISVRQERSQLEAFMTSNGVVSLRLNSTEKSLQSIRTAAEGFMKEIISRPYDGIDSGAVIASARSNLGFLVSELNRTAGGQYIYGGLNASQRPVDPYETTPTSAAKSAVDAAFLSAFGIPQTDPAVLQISPSDMAAFLDGPFASLFDEAAWVGAWSRASSEVMHSQVSAAEKVATSISANDSAIRKLAMAYTMAFDLGNAGLSAETRQVLFQKAANLVGVATKELTHLEAAVGNAQSRVNRANEMMDLQRNILDEKLGKLEGVDPAEAKTRVDALSTQIQISYSLTSQLRKLSLIDYI